MKQDIKKIINVSLHVFLHEVQDAILQGYVIDDNHPPSQWGMAYEVGMVRNDKTATQLLESAEAVNEGKPPKMTPAEKMEKARAARGSNKTVAQENVAN